MQDVALRRKLAVAGALGVGVITTIKVLRHLARLGAPGQEVPFAKGWWPFVGHVLRAKQYLKRNNKITVGLLGMDIKEKEGLDVCQLDFFGIKMISVSDPDLAEEIGQGDPTRFTKDFRRLQVDLMYKAFGEGLFFAATDDPKWYIAHNIVKAPFSSKGMKDLMPAMCDQADKLVNALKREVGYGGSAYIDGWVTKMAFETIAVCGMGTPLGSFDDDKPHPFIEALNDVVNGALPLFLCPSALRPILLRKHLARFHRNCKMMRETCADVIRKRRDQVTHRTGSRKDLLDMMLHDTDPKSGQGMTEEMIVDNVLTFLFAGQDSTAAAMASCLCFLCANPACKAKLLREIDDVVGQEQLQWEHLGKLQYLDWCIKETLRLVPPAAGFARQANGDQLLGGRWRIPNGTTVLVNIMCLHYDRKLWGPDAHEFRPERWGQGQPHKYAFAPFAVGPRACTGREFTVIEQKITMVKLFQHFDFRRPAAVQPEEGYTTMKREEQAHPPFIDMDVEFKHRSAFVGLFSSFELLERRR
uniref:Cytochrome P450 n=1 Tax=Pyrodinium bahamense TaxID=73915 RepID=A0A7S0FJV0_9DINO